MKKYVKASDYVMCYSLFKIKSSDQPIDMEDYDDDYYILKFYYYKNAPYTYELVCEDDWVDPEVAAYAEQFDDDFIQLRSFDDKLAVELWNKELRARGIDKTITERDLRQKVNRLYF